MNETLINIASNWPFGRKRPSRIRMRKTIRPAYLQDCRGLDTASYSAVVGQVYHCDCTHAGTVSALLPSGARVDLAPNSFDVVEWRVLV